MDANELPRELTKSWRAGAKCASYDPELWFPEDKRYWAGKPLEDKAKEICGNCEVRMDCLEAAVKEEIKGNVRLYGIRGGLNAKERTALLDRLLTRH